MSGEKPGYREAAEKLRGRMIRSGVASREAEARAQKIAVRRHRQAEAGKTERKT